MESITIKGITDEKVLTALKSVPRHLFLDPAFINFAYEDKPFPIGAGQTISQPYTVAVQTQLLQVQKGNKVLEIGTGSGYQTCILIELGAMVFTIERQRELFLKAKAFLPKLGYRANFFYGDGYNGLPSYAPFDKILVTAGAPYVPDSLLSQLKIGGILVIPVGKHREQVMKSVVRTGENEYNTREHGLFSFVPLLEDKQD